MYIQLSGTNIDLFPPLIVPNAKKVKNTLYTKKYIHAWINVRAMGKVIWNFLREFKFF